MGQKFQSRDKIPKRESTALICSATVSFDQVHFKHEQPQVLSPDSHVTIGIIQQTQDAANVLCI